MKTLLSDTVRYLEYLRTECRLSLSLHFEGGVLARLSDEVMAALFPYNSHTGSYCTAVKTRAREACLAEQQALLLRCREGVAFCHTCHAGVMQFIYPIRSEEAPLGLVAVSGYRGDAPASGREPQLWEAVLDPSSPPEPLLLAVLPPLAVMLSQLLSSSLREGDSEYHRILRYLDEYHANLTLSDLCRHLERSPSHVSHLFRSRSGKSIRAYCNERKLEDARSLLAETELSVTEIGFHVGFHDTAYFIGLFKRRFGITPLAYRRSRRV